MDDLDKYISNIVSKKIQEPSKYKYTIKHALENNRKYINFNDVLRKVAITIISVSTIGGLVFAMQAYKTNNKHANEEYTIENDEYIQKLDMEYQTKDDLSIKVNSILVDDFNIQLDIDYLYTEPITSAESDIIITDENNNLIFYSPKVEIDYEGTYKKRSRENFILNKDSIKQNDYSIKQTENYLGKLSEKEEYARGGHFDYQYITENNLRRIINTYIDDLDFPKFPKSNKLYIQLINVTLQNNKKKIKEINDKWLFEVNIDKKYISSKSYNLKHINVDKNNHNFKIIKAEASNVKLLAKIEYNGNEDINSLNSDCIQIWDERDNKYINASNFSEMNNIIDVAFDIDKNTFSNIIKIKIMNSDEIVLEREE